MRSKPLPRPGKLDEIQEDRWPHFGPRGGRFCIRQEFRTPRSKGHLRNVCEISRPRPPKEGSAGWTYLSNRPGVCVRSKGHLRNVCETSRPRPPQEGSAGWTYLSSRPGVCVCVRVDITVSLCALVVFCVCFNTPDKGFCLYPMLRNNASGPEIGHPGRISAGF